MAASAVLRVMSADDAKNVHPFFQRIIDKPLDAVEDDNRNNDADHTPAEQIAEVDAKSKKLDSKRKSRKDDGRIQGKIQTIFHQLSNPRTAVASDAAKPSVGVTPTEEIDQNDHRKKRRRTSDHGSVEVGSSEEADSLPASAEKRRLSPQVVVPRSSPTLAQQCDAASKVRQDVDVVAPRTPSPGHQPKKLLRINANGKFSSPPTNRPKLAESEAAALNIRGRPRRAAAVLAEKHLIVKIGYANDPSSKTALGDRISRVLIGEETIPLLVDESPSTPQRNRSKTAAKDNVPKKRTPLKTNKPAHPFFARDQPNGKPAVVKHDSPRKSAAVTPGKLRMQALADRSHDPRDHLPYVSTLNKDRLMIRHPGAKDPPLPSRDQMHVRALTGESGHDASQSHTDTFTRRKRKTARVLIAADESVLERFCKQLEPEAERALRSDGYREANAGLNVPERLMLSGQDIAWRIRAEVSHSLRDESVDELALDSSQHQTHPALQRLYDRIPTTATGFDDLRGESAAWAQKYAPQTSFDVLQPPGEMAVLKEWLTSLAVQTVVGAAASSKSTNTGEKERPKKKRKKKSDEMDDFLVQSDEEMLEMHEIADASPDSPVSYRRAPKSVVQTAPPGSKLSNVVMLSGPHGCGKTAAAYGVAKELGFKVFEISSSERRTGKDVLDRIGDMTENHLVKHHGTAETAAESTAAQETVSMEDALQKDLESGRQGKMSAFFKPTVKAPPKPKPAEQKNVVREKTLKQVKEALKQPPKDQQQSLILLEEVDVLFKDDKDFWTTIVKLVESSKRPFIMTCNDEDLVAYQTISLHAFLRLRPPALDLATDYMLLLAAAEGHLLKRNAVKTLYEHHNRDLRASITELDYWCQMGVGDPKEGLSWMFQRWPPGTDVDHFGRKIRVVSDNTYQQGMGLVPGCDPSAEEALYWAWENFDIEPSRALGWKAYLDEGSRLSMNGLLTSNDPKTNLRQLSVVAATADTLSAADACTSLGLPGSATLDATQPPMSDKARGSYIAGMELLQTDEKVDYSHLSHHLLIAMTLSAWKTYEVPPLNEAAVQSSRILHSIPAKCAQAAREEPLERKAFSCFDLISSPVEIAPANPGGGTLQLSVFDGPLRNVTLDLAPYVREIVRFDLRLEEQRGLLLEGDGDAGTSLDSGRKIKRARTTRAARSALEGSQRGLTRRERWFTKNLDLKGVLMTGAQGWTGLSEGGNGTNGKAMREESLGGGSQDEDTMMGEL